jgi:hypothetical protein
MNNNDIKIEKISNFDELKDIIQDCNINLLIGSGMSVPYFSTLGNIEKLLEELDTKKDLNQEDSKIIRASLYRKYFNSAMVKNKEIVDNEEGLEADFQTVFNNYKNLLQKLNTILSKRRNSILSRQINIFTTNIDIFLEKALEGLNVECNDGFSGRFRLTFDVGNFKKSYFKKSLHYDNNFELPVFNLLKIHGSLTWKKLDDKILFSSDLEQIQNINGALGEIEKNDLIEIGDEKQIEDLNSKLASTKNNCNIDSINNFITEYQKLAIVNPTKEKFKDTVINQTYYDLLRIYCNELEKENTTLLIMGFSFADEHISSLTVRAANSNPTLKIYIFAYEEKETEAIKNRLINNGKRNVNNHNITILNPSPNNYDFNRINKEVFDEILKKIEKKEVKNCNKNREESKPATNE